MFTTTVVLSVLKGAFKNTLKFFWEYKWVIILGMIIGFLYARGNHYEDKYRNETVAHLNAVLQHRQDINDIRLSNETALRVAQEESAAKYKELAEQTSSIQKEYLQREKDINTTITKLNSSNNSLQQTISNYTKRNSNSNESVLSDSTCTNRLSVVGELLRETKQGEQYYATEAQKLSNSVNTLKTWSDIVIESNREVKNDVK